MTPSIAALALLLVVLASVHCQPRPADARYQLTQEQLAQYVAAQQTQGAAPRYVTSAVPVPRHRQAVYKQPAPEQERDDGTGEQQQLAYRLQPEDASSAEIAAAYRQQQQQPIVYYRPQTQQPIQRKYKLRPDQVRLLPGPQGQRQEGQPDYDPNPQYQFSFDIKDDESTNYHNRKETRDGDKISGSYSVVDSDGYIRTVTYTADPQEGFKADVSRQPTDIVVKLPKHPTPPAGIAQQYQQLSPSQALLARKQITQQYLQASSPIESAEPEYAVVKPQQGHAYATGRTAAPPGTPAAAAAYFAAHRLSPAALPAPKAPKSYNPEQHPAASPLLYRAYQQ